jgi:hypothetical protein
MNLGRGKQDDHGEAPAPLPEPDLGEAFAAWMRHYRTCTSCLRAPTAEDDYLCPKGEQVRREAIKELTSTMPRPVKKTASDTPFNPSIASKQR